MSSLLFIGGYQLTQNSYADSAVRFMTVYSGLFLIQSFFIGQKSILAFAIIQCVSIAILSLILAFAFEIAGTNQFETMLAIIPIISSLYSLFAAVYIFVYHKPTQ